jgi:hypothetical protein
LENKWSYLSGSGIAVIHVAALSEYSPIQDSLSIDLFLKGGNIILGPLSDGNNRKSVYFIGKGSILDCTSKGRE